PLRRGEADAGQGAPDPRLRARARGEDRRGQRGDHPRRGPRLLSPSPDVPPLPIAAAVRPVVLALAPPAPGLGGGPQSPCLAPLGGSRLIERLLGTLAGQGLPTPLLVTGRSSGPGLRAVLGARVPVHEVADGDRRAALETALARTEEDLLLVHDAERALTPAATVGAVLEAMAEDADASVDAVVPVVAMTDSVKQVLPA